MNITPAKSFLPNSDPYIREPVKCKSGTLQVVWNQELDTHVLLIEYSDSKCVMALAAHHNGYSCHNLARRIAADDLRRSLEQLHYIRDCGGLVSSDCCITYVISGPEKEQPKPVAKKKLPLPFKRKTTN